MPKEKVDFSANINPLGPPAILKENWQSLFHTITDYPDPKGNLLKEKLANHVGITKDQLLLGNGGAELIYLIARMLAGKRVVIVQPAFSEYEEACRANGCTIDYHQLQPNQWKWDFANLSSKLDKADALFLCNPNNPTGIYYSKSTVLEILQLCAQKNCFLIVDEAFYDFVLNYEPLIDCISDFKNLLIIRSMTKMYAIPGLRLGYLIANRTIINKLITYQPQWSVNAIALKAGEWCLSNESYRNKTIELVSTEKKRLFSFYQSLNFQVSLSATNFYLLKEPKLKDQFPFFQFLLEKGIIPRHTMNFPGIDGEWIRFAIKAPHDNNRLMEAVVEWRDSLQSSL
nr:threonine-phosphate decarboxylase CobD [Bacillus sp. B15-48]